MTATADVLVMPGVRMLTARRLPIGRRRELLEWLARSSLDLPAEAVAVLRDAFAHESLCGPRLDEAWDTYRQAAALAEAAEMGILDWDWRCTSCGHLRHKECDCMCCPNPIDETRDDAAEALEVLAGGAS